MVSPATMLGSVIVMVKGVLAEGEVPPVACHDTAHATT
jgi:hypothetical protein